MQLRRLTFLSLYCCLASMLLTTLPHTGHFFTAMLPQAKVAVYLPVLQTLVVYAAISLLHSLQNISWAWLCPTHFIELCLDSPDQETLTTTTIFTLQLLSLCAITFVCHILQAISLNAFATQLCQAVLLTPICVQVLYCASLVLTELCWPLLLSFYPKNISDSHQMGFFVTANSLTQPLSSQKKQPPHTSIGPDIFTPAKQMCFETIVAAEEAPTVLSCASSVRESKTSYCTS